MVLALPAGLVSPGSPAGGSGAIPGSSEQVREVTLFCSAGTVAHTRAGGPARSRRGGVSENQTGNLSLRLLWVSGALECSVKAGALPASSGAIRFFPLRLAW